MRVKIVSIFLLLFAIPATAVAQDESVVLTIERNDDYLVIQNTSDKAVDVYDLTLRAFDYEQAIAVDFPDLASANFMLEPGGCLAYVFIGAETQPEDCQTVPAMFVDNVDVFWLEDILSVLQENLFIGQCALDVPCELSFEPLREVYDPFDVEANDIAPSRFVNRVGTCAYSAGNGEMTISSNSEGGCSVGLVPDVRLSNFERFGFEVSLAEQESTFLDMMLGLYVVREESDWWSVCGSRVVDSIEYAVFEVAAPEGLNVYVVLAEDAGPGRYQYRVMSEGRDVPVLMCMYNEEILGSVTLQDLPLEDTSIITRTISSNRPVGETTTTLSNLYTWPNE
jgi:hypothetical protein